MVGWWVLEGCWLRLLDGLLRLYKLHDIHKRLGSVVEYVMVRLSSIHVSEYSRCARVVA